MPASNWSRSTQPVDRVADKVAVAARFNHLIAEKKRIARDDDARVAARIGNARELVFAPRLQ